jgi:hypothetical protein
MDNGVLLETKTLVELCIRGVHRIGLDVYNPTIG